MNNFTVLLMGEMQRMKKYNIPAASFVVSILWIVILHFIGIRDVSSIFPLLVFVDATTMSMLLVGVTMFFEKQEGTLKTLLVSPISKAEYILAKSIANVISNLVTLFLMYLYAIFFKEIHVNIVWLTLAVILIGLFHALIGFLLTYYSKDFTELLVGMFKYAFVLLLPVFLEQVGMITGGLVQKLLYAIPTKASMVLLGASSGKGELWEVLLSTAYLLIGSVGLYRIVSKKFDEFAIKESGV